MSRMGRITSREAEETKSQVALEAVEEMALDMGWTNTPEDSRSKIVLFSFAFLLAFIALAIC